MFSAAHSTILKEANQRIKISEDYRILELTRTNTRCTVQSDVLFRVQLSAHSWMVRCYFKRLCVPSIQQWHSCSKTLHIIIIIVIIIFSGTAAQRGLWPHRP
jgi:hypothetical protein